MHLVRRTVERYVPVSDELWADMAPRWKLRAYSKGAFVSDAGRIEDHFFIVESGVQRLYVEHDGNEVCIGFAYDGSWSGDYDSFLGQRPGRFQVQAVTDSALWAIHYQDLQELFDKFPTMDRFGRLILEELFSGRATREVEQLTLGAEERYRRFIARSPHLLQLVAQKDIASYLRMTPETFSRLRARVR